MWYQPGNKYASKLYGTMVESVGTKYAINNLFSYYELPISYYCHNLNNKNIKIVKCYNNHNFGIYDFAKKIRGSIYAEAEELNVRDIELEALDSIYSKVGLHRKRKIWIAFSSKFSEPIGAAICYRGPFGLNFSLLENRCDLLVSEDIDEETTASVCHELIVHASTAYLNQYNKPEYPLMHFPVLTSGNAARIMKKIGFNPVREYRQCICMKEGFTRYYQHIENTFDVIVERMKKKAKKRLSSM